MELMEMKISTLTLNLQEKTNKHKLNLLHATADNAKPARERKTAPVVTAMHAKTIDPILTTSDNGFQSLLNLVSSQLATVTTDQTVLTAKEKYAMELMDQWMDHPVPHALERSQQKEMNPQPLPVT
jgi:hypothetical protein